MRRNGWLCVLAMIAAAGCDDGGNDGGDAAVADDGAVGAGEVTVILEAEDTITEGLEPGTEGESIQDGWTVTFDRYLIAIGDVDVHLSTDETVSAEAHEVWVVDLTAVPASGLPLWSFGGLQTGRWEFNYATPGAGDGAMRHESVEMADFTEMADNDWTYLIEGTITQTGGQSCPPSTLADPGGATSNGNANGGGDACYDAESIAFRLGVSAETLFGPCEVDEMPGFAVTAGGATTVAATIHGDHLFFNGFPEGDEGGIQRLAQWLADSDLNLDGEVTRAELEQIAPSDLPELDSRYQLGGSPVTPLEDMWDYVVAQMKTQGHFQGEGECPYDGVAHDH